MCVDAIPMSFPEKVLKLLEERNKIKNEIMN